MRTRVQCSKIVIRRRERKSLIYKLNFIVNIYMKKKNIVYIRLSVVSDIPWA